MLPICNPMAAMVPASQMGMMQDSNDGSGMGDMNMFGMSNMANMAMFNMVANMSMMQMMNPMGGMMNMMAAMMGNDEEGTTRKEGEIGPNGEFVEGRTYHGIVKTTNPENGESIFMVPGAREDVFAAKLDLPAALEGKPLAGQPFAFEVTRGSDGMLQAKHCRWEGGSSGSTARAGGSGHGSSGGSGSRGGRGGTGTARSRSRRRRRSGSRQKQQQGFGWQQETQQQAQWPCGGGAWGASSETPAWQQRQQRPDWPIGGFDGRAGMHSYNDDSQNQQQFQQGWSHGEGGQAAFGGNNSMQQQDETWKPPASWGCCDGPPVRTEWGPGGMNSGMGGGAGCGARMGQGTGTFSRPGPIRMQGVVRSWACDWVDGTIQSPMLPSDALFNFEDIPPILQRDEEARTWLLGEGARVIFTIGDPDSGVQPRASEVMPIPGTNDIIVGRVKNYGANSGYGFMRPMEDAPFTHDIFFNHRDFTTGNLDQRMKLEGALCKFNVRLTPDGKGQAKNIELLAWPPGADPGPNAYSDKSLGATNSAIACSGGDAGARSTGMKLQGIIQVYKSANGYGFIRSPKLGRDVWFPRRELPMDLVGKELPGTHVEFELWLHGDEKPHARSIHLLQEDPTEALRLDLMSGRGKGRNMTVEEKVAIWHARTGKSFPAPGSSYGGGSPSAGDGG